MSETASHAPSMATTMRSSASRVQNPSRAMNAARIAMINKMEACDTKTKELERTLARGDEELAQLAEENQRNRDAMAALDAKSAQNDRDPRNIAAEDALDTIVRLQNTLRVAKRRNTMLTKENAATKKRVKEQNGVLTANKNYCDKLIGITGWHEGTNDDVDVDLLRTRISNMIQLEATIKKELATGKVILIKKEQLVKAMEEELEQKVDLEEQINKLNNDIRVKSRDVAEVSASIDALKRDDRKRDSALVVAENSRDVVALEALEGDKDYLRTECAAKKTVLKDQDLVLKAQRKRADQLHTRNELITMALRDLKLDKEFEAAASRLIVSDPPIGDPTDPERIHPTDETIPVETYELMHRDLSAMGTSISRKDIMILEKQASVDALDSKLSQYKASHEGVLEQEKVTKVNKTMEVADLQEELGSRHAEYRRQIDEMLTRNLKLKTRIAQLQQADE